MFKDFKVAEKCKPKLREPIGKIISESKLRDELENFNGKVIVVGDQVTLNFLENDLKANIYIVDKKIKRAQISEKEEQLINSIDCKILKTKNPSSTISLEAWETLKNALKESRVLIDVDGEEDLLTLVALFLSKENTKIFYGQPDVGIVVVEVTSKLKQEYSELLISSSAKEFLDTIEGKTIILYHSDADGCCSAALFIKYLNQKNIETEPIFTNDVLIHENLKNEIKNSKAKNLIIVDLGGEAESAIAELSETLKVLVLDHHKLFSNNFGNALVLNPHMFEIPDEAIAPTSYLSYRIVNICPWICAIGVISDKGFVPCQNFLEKVKKEYNVDFDSLVDLINAADSMKNSEIALQELVKANALEDIIKSTALLDFKKTYEEELNNLLEEHKGKVIQLNKVIFYEIKSEYYMRGEIANKLQILYPNKIIIIGEEEDEHFAMSLRTNLKNVDLVVLIKNSIKGLEDAHGGGHSKASGCKVLLKDKDVFLERFVNEAR